MNMSYCRFRNTSFDLTDCLEALASEETLSASEIRAGKQMFAGFLEFCEANEIIEGYNLEAVASLFGDEG